MKFQFDFFNNGVKNVETKIILMTFIINNFICFFFYDRRDHKTMHFFMPRTKEKGKNDLIHFFLLFQSMFVSSILSEIVFGQ